MGRQYLSCRAPAMRLYFYFFSSFMPLQRLFKVLDSVSLNVEWVYRPKLCVFQREEEKYMQKWFKVKNSNVGCHYHKTLPRYVLPALLPREPQHEREQWILTCSLEEQPGYPLLTHGVAERDTNPLLMDWSCLIHGTTAKAWERYP